MKDQGVSQLPRLYREYLEVMGKNGLLSVHNASDWSYQRLLRIKQDWQDEIVREKVTFIIPEQAFVFFQHGGYEYRYFMTDTDYDDDGDCPTYLCLEEDTEQGYHVSVSSTLREYFENHADWWSRTGKFEHLKDQTGKVRSKNDRNKL